MKEYRVPFFLMLEKELARDGIELVVVYGRADMSESENASLPCPVGRSVREFRLFGKVLLLNAFRYVRTADLVVVEHANKNAINYGLYFLSIAGIKRIANWSHGYNRQGDSRSLGERFKRLSLHWCDWWFAYTDGGRDYIESQGFSADRITVVQNSIDTTSLKSLLASISAEEVNALRHRFGWSSVVKTAVYCGSLYEAKRIDLLLSSAALIHERCPEFRLLIVGDGAGASMVIDFAQRNPWCVYVGSKYGRDKALFLKSADIFLNPGVVGLSILDAFCAGLPFVSCLIKGHGPEIEYLHDGENGFLVEATANDIAVRVVDLLCVPSELQRLKSAALEAADRYSISVMVSNFAAGVKKALSL